MFFFVFLGLDLSAFGWSDSELECSVSSFVIICVFTVFLGLDLSAFGWSDSELECSVSSFVITVLLASDPCTRLLDGYKGKKTDKNCPNHTIKEKMHGQLC